MAQSILELKEEDIDNVEKRRKYTVAVIGCNPIGLLHAYLFAEAGFKVFCVDKNHDLISKIGKGKSYFLKNYVEPFLKKYLKKGYLKATTNIKEAVSKSDIIVITTPVKVDEKARVNYLGIEKICKIIGSVLRKGTLTIVATIVGVGITENLIKENLENSSGFKAGKDFGLAFSPLIINDGYEIEELKHKRILAAVDNNSLKSASLVLKTLGFNLTEIKSLRVAEAATLFTIVSLDVNSALAIELAVFCEKIGVDYFNTQKLMETLSSSARPLQLNFGGINLREAYVLLNEAEDLDVKLQVSTVARKANMEAFKHAIHLIREAFKKCGKALKRARITIFGLSQTPNTNDIISFSTRKLIKTLEKRGVKLSVYDPYFSSRELTEMGFKAKRTLTEALEGADCLIFATEHEKFKHLNLKRLKVIMKKPAAIVDLVGIIEPEKAQKEEFIYCGLGRGVESKWKS